MRQARMYPEELKERAVRLVFEIYEEGGSRRGAVARVSAELGIHVEALRKWVHQAEVDQGMRPGHLQQLSGSFQAASRLGHRRDPGRAEPAPAAGCCW